MSKVKSFEFGSSQEAWEQLNEYLACEDEEIIEMGGTRNGPLIISYNIFVRIRKAWVDPGFDFGYMFGYRIQKWSKLLSNYVNLNYLDLVKSEVQSRESKKNQAYNVSFLFDNAHISGHGCLLNLTFIRRHKVDHPILQMTLRASEVTKRLLMDLLLVQRMGEYVYGKDQHISIEIFFPHIYLSSESFTMYDNHKPIKELFKGRKGKFQEKILGILNKFKTVDPTEITYKVHLRSVRQLQRVDGIPLSGDKHLYAKDLSLIKTRK